MYRLSSFFFYRFLVLSSVNIVFLVDVALNHLNGSFIGKGIGL